MTPGTRNDALRLQLSGSDVIFMRVSGAIAGIVVLAAAARNGAGQGRLILSTTGLAWQAPGSAMPGPQQLVVGDGIYMLEDGYDSSAWLRVQVYVSYLPASGEAVISIGDTYNAFGPDDVAAADALAGITENVTFTLKNVSPQVITAVKLWLDPAVANVTVSSDGVNYYDPVSETDPHVLAWPSIGIGASVNVYLRRVIGSTAASNAKILNLMQFSWTGV